MAHRDVGLGYGWAHTFGWEAETAEDKITVWNEQGVGVEFPALTDGQAVTGPWGWLLRREGNSLAVDAGDDVVRTFTRDEEEGRRYRLVAIEDANQNRIRLRWTNGCLVQVEDSVGRTLAVSTTPTGRIGSLAVALAPDRQVVFATYDYDDAGNLRLVTDAEGHTSRYAYDGEHRLVVDTDRVGLTFHFAYDEQGRCVESWGDYDDRPDPSLAGPLPRYLADGVTPAKGIHHCRFTYDDDYYSEVADSMRVRRFFGNRFGTLDRIVEDVATSTCTYDERGCLTARTDPLGETTRFERDDRGRTTCAIDPLGRKLTLRRNTEGLVIEVRDPTEAVTKLERDARGNVVRVVDALGGVTTAQYDPRGLRTEIVDPDGGRSTYAYDEQGNCVEIRSANGGVWRATYDALGRVVARTDPLGATTHYTRSVRGDLVEITDALEGVTRFRWDGERHPTEVTDAKGTTTKLVWGGYHKLCARRNADGKEVHFRYDPEGNLTEVHNERGETHRFQHNQRGLVVVEETFDGRNRRFCYDLCSRPTLISDALTQTRLWYDPVGRLVKRQIGEGVIEEYEYNAFGALTAVRWPGGEERFEYDALGNLISEVQSVEGEEHRVDITYDVRGYRTGRRTSLGHTEVIARDAIGARLSTVLDGEHRIEYARDLLGREVSRTLPGGGRIESVFDSLNGLLQRRATGSTPHLPGVTDVTALTTYTYNRAGQIIERHDRRSGRTTFGYDRVGQLISMTPERTREALFHFDPAGNLHEQGPGAEEREYGPGNQLLRKGQTMYSWDANGRLVEKRAPQGVWRYHWTGVGLLRSVERPDGTAVEYTYDPFARRLLKRIVAPADPDGARAVVAQTRYVWDDDVMVHELCSGAGQSDDPTTIRRTYCFEDDSFEPMAQRDTKGWVHYVNDPNGTPERILADDGSVACELTREAWGKASVNPGATAATPFGYQGQYHDDETGLEYNRYRYYDADVGRYISPDPIGIVANINLYTFVPDPLGMIDPLGLGPADKLRAAMRDAGRGCAECETPHHIVQRNGGGAGGQDARDCLARNNIDIDEHENGTALKGAAKSQRKAGGHSKGCKGYHGGSDIHGDEAQEAIAKDLLKIEKKHGTGTLQTEAALRQRLLEIGAMQRRRQQGNRIL